MKKHSFFYILTLVVLCVCLTGCRNDLPEASVPALALPEVTTTFPATESSERPATEATLESTTVPVTEAMTEPTHIHDFGPATCTAPETCTVCGTTSGSAAGHTFSGGSCTFCGMSDPNNSGETMVWIPTRGGTKYHSNNRCSNMIDPEQVTETEAQSRGFAPCKKCY